MEQSKSNRTLDMIRFIALLLVSYAHLVVTPIYALEIPGVLSETLDSPLFPVSQHYLAKPSDFFYGHFGIESAVVGVVLFFLVSGYLIPQMQDKYSSKCLWGGDTCLLFNRMKRIYPVLFICVFLNGVLVAQTQGIVYPFKNYLSTATVTISFTGLESSMGVLWYLMVLFFVYMLCTLVSKITLENLSWIYFVLYILVILPRGAGDFEYSWMLSNIQFLAKYSGIVLLGAAAYLCKDYKKVQRLFCLLWFFVLAFGLLVFAKYLYGDTSTYSLLNTYIAAVTIIGVLKLLDRYVDKLIKKCWAVIVFLKRISLPFYLLHVHFGIITIYYMRGAGIRAEVCVLAAYAVSLAMAFTVQTGANKIEAIILNGLSVLRKNEKE